MKENLNEISMENMVYIVHGYKHVCGLDTKNNVNTVTDEQTSNCSQIFVR